MAWWNSWIGKPIDLNASSAPFWRGFFGASTTSGEVVSIDRALGLDAFWACASLIQDAIGTLPCVLYDTDGVTPAKNDDLYGLLHDLPNADDTASEFWSMVALCLCTDGNFFAEKKYVGNKLVALSPLNPCAVDVKRTDGNKRIYEYTEDGKTRKIPEDRMFHVRGKRMPGDDRGISPVYQLRNVLGSAMAGEKAGAKVYKSGLISTTLLSSDQVLTKEQRTQLADTLKSAVGAENAGGVAVLEAGLTPHTISVKPVDAQMLESRQYAVEQVCRIFGVPPVMIGHAADGTTTWGCLPGDTPVFTNDGPVAIKDIERGDVVWSFDGEKMVLSPVKAKMMTGHRHVMRIETAGRTLDLTDNHVVFVRRYSGPGRGRKMLAEHGWRDMWVRADDVRAGDYLAIPHGLDRDAPERVPSVGRMELAGLYIGDGSFDGNRVEIAHEDGADYIGHYADVVEREFGVRPYLDATRRVRTRFSSKDAVDFLRDFAGESHTKRVPSWVFGLPDEQVLAFLRGYVDSDGAIVRGRILYSSCNKELLEDVRHLCMLVGVPCGRVYQAAPAGETEICGRKCQRRAKYHLSLSSVSHNHLIGSNSQKKLANISVGGTTRVLSYDEDWRDNRPSGHHISQTPGAGWGVKDLSLQRVRRVKGLSSSKVPVYDIEVDGTASFVADGVLVHNSGIEQLILQFSKTCLRPMLQRIEDAIYRDLLTPEQRKTRSVKFNMDAFLEGDSTARAAFLSKMVDSGIYTVNEARGYENKPGVDGGDRSIVNGTMTRLDKVGEQPAANDNAPEAPKNAA